MTITQTFEHEAVKAFRFGYAPLGKPRLLVYVYFIDGLLIDTGQPAMSTQIAEATQNLPVEQIFISHHHEDHTGNIQQLQQQHNCKVYAPLKTCEIMKNPPKLTMAQKLVWGNRGACPHLTPIANDIKTKNYQFNIIPIPGHATDMAALYEPNKKWLFSSDLFIGTKIGYYLYSESMQQQIASTKKILKLDFDTMYCAHNPQLKNGKQKLTRKLEFLESFFEDVSVLYKQGLSAKAIFKQLKLEENYFVKILSGGKLSKLNMVKSVINDLEKSST